MFLKIDINAELERLFQDFPVLSNRWKNSPFKRKSMKEILASTRLTEREFDIQEYSNLFNSKKIDSNLKIKVLFAHFSPFLYEVEGLGLPVYFKKMFPNCIVDFTYDKGGSTSYAFRISNDSKTVIRLNKSESSYDLIIARSSVLNNMMARKYDQECIKNSKYIVNVKTMSYSPNYQYADYYFEEEDMCPPPDPFCILRSGKFLEKIAKEKLIVVSGTLWYVKNQLKMFQQLDPLVIKDYRIVILGPVRDSSYVNNIIDECNRKSIHYYLIGNVHRNMANDIKSLSKISIIPMDMRVFGQPKGYPRTLGESIGSKCLTICNKPVTIPAFYKDACRVYDEEIPNDLNLVLEKSIRTVSDKNFIAQHNWGNQDFEDFCAATILKCLSLAGYQLFQWI